MTGLNNGGNGRRLTLVSGGDARTKTHLVRDRQSSWHRICLVGASLAQKRQVRNAQTLRQCRRGKKRWRRGGTTSEEYPATPEATAKGVEHVYILIPGRTDGPAIAASLGRETKRRETGPARRIIEVFEGKGRKVGNQLQRGRQKRRQRRGETNWQQVGRPIWMFFDLG